jgi:hypothetical protein
MKLSFNHKNAIRLAILLTILAGIFVFIYFQLQDEDISLDNLETQLSSKEKSDITNGINESGGTKIQQYAVTGAMKNNDKITIDEIAKIHALNDE